MLKMGFKALLGQANTEIETISVDDAKRHLDSANVLFIDVRETQEVQSTGGLPGHVHVPRGFLVGATGELKGDAEEHAGRVKRRFVQSVKPALG